MHYSLIKFLSLKISGHEKYILLPNIHSTHSKKKGLA